MSNQPPPWCGYERIEGAPYPMTGRQFRVWLATHAEPGYKYELHAGLAVRLKRDPATQRIINKLAEALGAYADAQGGVVIVNQEPEA